MDPPEPQVLRFQTTAKASADAHALAHVGLARVDLIVDGAALIIALVLALAGNVLLGLVIAVIAVLSLIGSRFHPVQRLLIAARYRSILGRSTEVTIEDEGLRFENSLGSSFIPWSTITAVRSNSQTLAFFRDSVLLGYIPSAAFDTPAEQAKAMTFVQARIAPST